MVNEGQTASFTVAATGSGLSYQWQRQASGGGSWANVGTNSNSYTTPVTTAADNGAKFHCLVSNLGGSVTSNEATLTVNAVAPVITVHPSDRTVNEGQTATFTVTATGSGLSYQWQKKPSGGSWANVTTGTGGITASYTTAATIITDDNGAQFHCVVTNGVGSVNSSAATLTVTVSQPNYALSFDGTNDYVTFGKAVMVNGTMTNGPTFVSETGINPAPPGNRSLQFNGSTSICHFRTSPELRIVQFHNRGLV